jgi:hypothetical protein
MPRVTLNVQDFDPQTHHASIEEAKAELFKKLNHEDVRLSCGTKWDDMIITGEEETCLGRHFTILTYPYTREQ